MRDQFAVELGKLSQSRSGDEASSSYPKWYYFKVLLFLKDVVTPRVSTRNLTRPRSATSVDLNTETTDSPSVHYSEDDDEINQPSKRYKMSYNDKILDIENQRLFLLKKKQSREKQ